MSFSAKVKDEICRNNNGVREEELSELSAIMKMSGTLSLASNKQLSFSVTTENAAIARHVFKLLKSLFKVHSKLIVRKSSSLKKNNIYIVMITEEMGVRNLLKEVAVINDLDGIMAIEYGIPSNFTSTEGCKRAYIKGAFLGGGSISNPEKTYHLEFVTHDLDYAEVLSDLINNFDLSSKVIQRKNSYIIYLKEGEQIVDLLNIIGAHSSLFQLENVRIMKEMRNNVNRLVNCETANLSKTVNASVRQVQSIKLIESEIGLKRLPKNLREIAELRIEYPDESLKELGEFANPVIGKSGVNHRLRKIEKIADELRNEGK